MESLRDTSAGKINGYIIKASMPLALGFLFAGLLVSVSSGLEHAAEVWALAFGGMVFGYMNMRARLVRAGWLVTEQKIMISEFEDRIICCDADELSTLKKWTEDNLSEG